VRLAIDSRISRGLGGIGRGVAMLQAVRHCLMVVGHWRSWRHLRTLRLTVANGSDVTLLVVLPVIQEQERLASGVSYMRSIIESVDRALVVIVTTEREARRPAQGMTTPALASKLAAADDLIVHVHCADPAARKGDQINEAVVWAERSLSLLEDHGVAIVVYDVDSRPTAAALCEIAASLRAHPDADVFHQSSRFEVRDRRGPGWSRVVADAGALRANRFVMSTELPRLLNRDPRASPVRRALASVTYGHVSGHGLVVRLPAAQELPLPPRTELEDMAYSFVLATRRVPVVPLVSLDVADVPRSLRAQFEQQARWFKGPSRACEYGRNPASGHGLRATLVTVSAFLGAMDWLMSAFTVPILWDAVRANDRRRAGALRVLIVACLLELVSADCALGASEAIWERAARIAAYPLSNTLFGVAGWWSLATFRRPPVS
jgi:hypothetical protein